MPEITNSTFSVAKKKQVGGIWMSIFTIEKLPMLKKIVFFAVCATTVLASAATQAQTSLPSSYSAPSSTTIKNPYRFAQPKPVPSAQPVLQSGPAAVYQNPNAYYQAQSPYSGQVFSQPTYPQPIYAQPALAAPPALTQPSVSVEQPSCFSGG